MTRYPVLLITPNGDTRVYRSIRAAARVLSGNGGQATRKAITEAINVDGGSFVGTSGVFATFTNHPGSIRRR